MSIPSSFFLDTSILDRENYNFNSTAFSSFIAVNNDLKLRLLLPRPTEQEILEHIRTRSGDALKALEKARRSAPFLSKWKHWPEAPTGKRPEWEVHRIAKEELTLFFSRFNLQRLDYNDVKIDTIMSWYFNKLSPFKEGKKRKEFPDAIALESIVKYAAKNSSFVAIVSDDPDFKDACERYSNLLYFPSLPKLTELLLSKDQRLTTLRTLINNNMEYLNQHIWDNLEMIMFYPEQFEEELVNSETQSINNLDTNIVSIGDKELTLTFNFELKSLHTFRQATWEGPEEESFYTEEETVESTQIVGGIAKIQTNETLNKIESISRIEFDQEELPIRSPFSKLYNID